MTDVEAAVTAGRGVRNAALKHSQWVQSEELEIVFVDAAPPPLPAGEYRLGLDQTVAWSGGSTDDITSEYDFTVSGPRFTLDPVEAHSMFPPPGHRGHFQKYLPHMVFVRRSLPWERTIDGSIPRDKPYIPWLWLLSLDEAEIAAHNVAVETRTVADVLDPPERVLGPDMRIESGEDPASELLVLDVPTALINPLLPSKEDLAYTASARLVSIMHKALSAETKTGWFSSVMSNRFPSNGQRNTQFLVSLEGYGTTTNDILYPNGVDPEKYDAVRFVMLLSWDFDNVDDDQTFEQLMQDLSVDRLQRPHTSGDTTVASAFDMGFTALNHITREGERNVSWYRGPALPLDMPKSTPDIYANGDAALRFDPAIGMFDVSYAAAWQIGRFLGLQDGEFAAAIARMRDSHKRALHTLAARSFMIRQLTVELALPTDFRELLGRQVFDRAWMELWGRVLGPRLAPAADDDDAPPALLGAPADPSGLERHRAAMPALLSQPRLLELFEQPPDDLLAELLQRIRENGEHR